MKQINVFSTSLIGVLIIWTFVGIFFVVYGYGHVRVSDAMISGKQTDADNVKNTNT